MIWSQITIPGNPRILIVDGTRNTQGWENEFAARIFTVLKRKGLDLVGDVPLRPSQPQDLNAVLEGEDSFNFIPKRINGPMVNVDEKITQNVFGCKFSKNKYLYLNPKAYEHAWPWLSFPLLDIKN